MKTYPSIPQSKGQKFRSIPNAIIFDKLDGSNLRFEWGRKSGWTKYGTRTQLFDESHVVFAPAISLFYTQWAEELEKIAKKQRWEKMTAFFEFWGKSSFAGWHDLTEEKNLTLIDISVHKQGIIGPREFLKLFGDLEIPVVLDECNWTRDCIQRVWDEEVAGITFEGVVAKAGNGHDLVMAKAKTKSWVEKVKAQYGNKAQAIIDS